MESELKKAWRTLEQWYFEHGDWKREHSRYQRLYFTNWVDAMSLSELMDHLAG